MTYFVHRSSNLLHANVFLVFFPKSTPNYIPLKLGVHLRWVTKLCPFILCSVTHWCQCRLWKKRPNKHLHNSTKHGSFEHLFWHKKSHLDTCFNFGPWLMYYIPQCTTICGHWKFDIKLSPFVNYIISVLQCCILWGFEIFKWVKFGPRRWT